jgi:hypothetical protein
MPKPCQKCSFKPETIKIEPKQCNVCNLKLDGLYKDHLATELHKSNKDIMKTVKSLIKSNKVTDLIAFVKNSKKHF